MLTVNDVGLVDDLADPVDDMMAPLVHPVCHIAQIRGEQHRLMASAPQSIGEKLNDTEVWHSHSRGIPMEVLRHNLKLLINDFGSDPALARPVHDYFRLLSDYRMRRGHEFFVLHTKGRHVGF